MSNYLPVLDRDKDLVSLSSREKILVKTISSFVESFPTLFVNFFRISATPARASAPREIPASTFVFVLHVFCEEMVERSTPFWDLAGRTFPSRGTLLSLTSELNACSISAKKPTSLGSTFSRLIYLSPLSSEIFMIKELMLITLHRHIWTRNPKWNVYDITNGEST